MKKILSIIILLIISKSVFCDIVIDNDSDLALFIDSIIYDNGQYKFAEEKIPAHTKKSITLNKYTTSFNARSSADNDNNTPAANKKYCAHQFIDDEGGLRYTDACDRSDSIFPPFPNYVKFGVTSKKIIIKEKK